MKKILSSKYFLATLAIVSLVSYSFIVFAAVPSGGYAPGGTLDPECAPGDTSPEPCIVQLPSGGSLELYVENPVTGYTPPVATGDNAVAIGDGTTASEASAIAGGFGTTASGFASTAFGQGTQATAAGTFAVGDGAVASGQRAVAMGDATTASGQASMAVNFRTTASGDSSFAQGFRTTAYSYLEAVFGIWNTAYTPSSTTSASLTDRLVTIGNGTGTGARSDAFTILKNGKTGIGFDNFETTTFDALLQVDGSILSTDLAGCTNSLAVDTDGMIECGATGSAYELYSENPVSATAASAAGDNAVAIGTGATAPGMWGMALGRFATATGIGSTAFYGGEATGDLSFAVGDEAHAERAFAFYQDAYGVNSVAFGATAYSFNEFSLGNRPTSYAPASATAWDSADRLFNIGNGELSGSDAFTVLKSGQIGVAIDNFEAVASSAASPCTTSLFQVGDGDNGAAIGCVNAASGDWAIASDRRLKENISDLSYGLDTVRALVPKQYDYIRNGEHAIGFIAQDVQGIVPEAVIGTDYLGISYATFVPVLTRAIQELDVKLQAVEMAATSVPTGTSFDGLRAWFADAANGIESLFAKKITTTEICVTDAYGETCLTRSDIEALLGNDSDNTSGAPIPDEPSDETGDESGIPDESVDPEAITELEPVVENVPQESEVPESVPSEPEPTVE